jgi:hypothetical protein
MSAPPARLGTAPEGIRRDIVMNLPSKTLAVALLAAASYASPAGALPIGAPLLHDAASPTVQTVQWRGGHRWGGGWGGRGWGWGGVGAGLVAGAIIGGAVAASQPYGYDYGYDYSPGYYNYGYAPGYSSYGYAPGGYVESAPGGDVAYCAQRFRSYDPASGTYLGYDGYRHPCP